MKLTPEQQLAVARLHLQWARKQKSDDVGPPPLHPSPTDWAYEWASLEADETEFFDRVARFLGKPPRDGVDPGGPKGGLAIRAEEPVDDESVEKHLPGRHNQLDHGNWARNLPEKPRGPRFSARLSSEEIDEAEKDLRDSLRSINPNVYRETDTETFVPCARCDGEGGKSFWPGFTCFKCDGRRGEWVKNESLRRTAARQLKAEREAPARRQQRQADLSARRVANWKSWSESHPELARRVASIVPLLRQARSSSAVDEMLRVIADQETPYDGWENWVARYERAAYGIPTDGFKRITARRPGTTVDGKKIKRGDEIMWASPSRIGGRTIGGAYLPGDEPKIPPLSERDIPDVIELWDDELEVPDGVVKRLGAGLVAKHLQGRHDEKTHGRWADGEAPADDSARTTPTQSPRRSPLSRFRTRDEVESGFKPKQFAARRAALDREEAKVLKAVAVGELSPEDAARLGWDGRSIGTDLQRWAPLPGTLYHATGATEAIMSEGFKTRRQVGVAALGGGTADMVSFTESPELARTIADALREVHDIGTGRLTAADLIADARQQGFFADMVRYWDSGWREGDPLPDGLQQILDGVVVTKVGLPITEDNPRFQEVLDRTGRYVRDLGVSKVEPVFEKFGKLPRALTKVRFVMSPEGRARQTMEVYKLYSMYREQSGGPTDPLFWGTDPVEFSRRFKRDDIGVVKVATKPGAYGEKMTALGEWRTLPSALAETEVVSKYYPGGKDHNQKLHGRRRGKSGEDVSLSPGTSIRLKDSKIRVDDDEWKAAHGRPGHSPLVKEVVSKHLPGLHDQKDHGNWARGRRRPEPPAEAVAATEADVSPPSRPRKPPPSIAGIIAKGAKVRDELKRRVSLAVKELEAKRRGLMSELSDVLDRIYEIEETEGLIEWRQKRAGLMNLLALAERSRYPGVYLAGFEGIFRQWMSDPSKGETTAERYRAWLDAPAEKLEVKLTKTQLEAIGAIDQPVLDRLLSLSGDPKLILSTPADYDGAVSALMGWEREARRQARMGYGGASTARALKAIKEKITTAVWKPKLPPPDDSRRLVVLQVDDDRDWSFPSLLSPDGTPQRTLYERLVRSPRLVRPEDVELGPGRFAVRMNALADTIASEMSNYDLKIGSKGEELDRLRERKRELQARIPTKPRLIREETRKVLAELGVDFADELPVKRRTKGSGDVVARAGSFYPRSWVERAVELGYAPISVRKVNGRAYYDHRNHIAVRENDLSAGIHEVGHMMERIPEVGEKVKAFFEYRTEGSELVSLSGEFRGRPEVARPDDFSEPYMGKVYEGQPHWEVLSTGLQHMFTYEPGSGPYPDDEHLDFLIGLLLEASQ